MAVGSGDAQPGRVVDVVWPGWYRRLVVGAVLVASGLAALGWWLGPPNGPPAALVLSQLIVPGAISVAVFAGGSGRWKYVFAAALLIDLEALFASALAPIGLAYAVLFPVVGVALLVGAVGGRALIAGFIAAGSTSLVGVTIALLFGPASHEPRIGVPIVTLAITAIFIGVGLVHLGLLYKDRMRALASARDDLASRRAAEDLLAAIVDSTPVPTQAFDADGNVILWNPASERLFGWKRSEVVGGRIPAEMDPPDAPLPVTARIGQTLAGEVVRGDRVRRLTKDGREVWIDIYASPIHDADGKPIGVAGQTVDVTERIALDARLRQAAKMEAIGVLAGGIAHDFNNMLTAIRGYADLARTEVPLSGEVDVAGVRDDLTQVILAADRASELTRQLLAFARKTVLEPRVLDPVAVVSGFAPMVRRLLGEDVDLVLEFGPEAGLAKVDPAQLEQVILNLAVNGRDAMPAGGQLRIDISNVTLGDDYTAGHPDARPGPYVRLTVADTGVGMDEETRSHVFEPFFTTKGPGQGTGMGLATVFGVVKMSDGSIDFRSEPGKGTTFDLYFPRIPAGAAPAVSAEPPDETPRGSETILFVEDDPAVRPFGRRCLAGLGYTVLEASSGAEALSVVGSFEGSIDLLLSDVVMPGMQGPELARRLSELRPGLRVLYCSGFHQNPAATDGASGSAYLAKPYSRESLARAVRASLDRAG